MTSHPLAERRARRLATLDTARDLAAEAGYARVYAIGGAGIYQAFLPVADRLLITDVALDIPDADTFFPVRGG